MRIKNARQETRTILSFFSESFSRPSFKFFSASSSVSSIGKKFTLLHGAIPYPLDHAPRIALQLYPVPGRIPLTVEEVTETALHQFFQRLQITVRDVLFLIVDDTLLKKTARGSQDVDGIKDHAQNMANVFGHQWVVSALLYKDFLLPLWAKTLSSKGREDVAL